MILFPKVARADTQFQLNAQRLATRLAFFSLGFATAAWAPLIPFAQQRLHLDHAHFGLLLLCTGLGAMLAMPTAGLLIYRLGCKFMIGFAMILLLALLPVLALGNSAVVMAIGLFLFGSAAGSLGVAVNFQAVWVEKQADKAMMSGFHGMCSLGGLMGALSITALLALHVSALLSVLICSFVLIILSLVAVPYSLSVTQKSTASTASDQDQTVQSEQKRPNLLIVLIGLTCFISFLSEGAAMDWSGIYLSDKYTLNTAYTGLGYTCFAVAMTFARLFGQKILSRLGENRTIQYSAISAFLGLSIVVFAPHWAVALLGYGLLGLGSANIVPIMFSRAGKQMQVQKAAALSCVSTIAYTGSLVGPALVGFISQSTGLSAVFMGIAILLVSILLLNRFSQIKASI